MVDFVTRDGSRLTPWMLYQIDRLDADMRKLFGVGVRVTSGIRLAEEQEAIFRERYRAGAYSPYGDYRWWQGVKWGRISAAGTVAVPTTSNHEIQGTTAAVDLRDTGTDAGIATAGSARSNWLRAHAADYGLVASGFGFGEAWHYDIPGIYQTPPTQPAPTPIPTVPEEDDMARLIRWNSGPVFGISREAVYHVPDTAQLAELTAVYGQPLDVGDAGLTAINVANGLHWDVYVAILAGKGLGVNGRYWSRLMAEGEASRTLEAAQTKTIEDVRAAVEKIAG